MVERTEARKETPQRLVIYNIHVHGCDTFQICLSPSPGRQNVYHSQSFCISISIFLVCLSSMLGGIEDLLYHLDLSEFKAVRLLNV